MLHRLAVHLKMDALLFQLSVFSVFNKILSDPAAAAYTVQKWCVKGNIWLVTVLPKSNLSLIWYEARLRCELSVPGTGHLCQVRAEPFLCTDGTEQQGVHWTVVLEKCGGCTRDDRRLQQRQVRSFLFSHCLQKIFFQKRKLVAHYR